MVTQIGPINTTLVICGACATAICADLGARTIRAEIDAMEVLGIDPIHRLVVPRVLAAAVAGLLLNALVCVVGLVGGFLFGVYLQHISSGAYLANLPSDWEAFYAAKRSSATRKRERRQLRQLAEHGAVRLV